MKRVSTYNTAVINVLDDSFMVHDLTLENTTGAGLHQAVALRLDSTTLSSTPSSFVATRVLSMHGPSDSYIAIAKFLAWSILSLATPQQCLTNVSSRW